MTGLLLWAEKGGHLAKIPLFILEVCMKVQKNSSIPVSK